MKDRIKLIMENENLTPAKFADRLQINRAVVSHILNGRNNPSLDVVTKILGEMNYINPEWLLNGTGNMYKEGIDVESIPKEPDLFSQTAVNKDELTGDTENVKESNVKSTLKPEQLQQYQQVVDVKKTAKKISQIIIYYNDNTFETFIPPMTKN